MLEIPVDLMMQFEELSRSQNRSVEELIQEALRKYLATQQFKALRQRTVPLAKSQGFQTDEDLFREVS